VQYHKEIFAAMYEDAAGFVDPSKLVYPFDIEYAMERLHKSIYHNSMKTNAECAKDIEETIDASLHGNHHYNLDIAAIKVINQYGFERVNMVLAYNIQEKYWDGRFSNACKQWAKDVWVPRKSFRYTNMDTNPGLLDMFADKVIKLYREIDAERFALPGRAESGEFIGTSGGRLQGYEITHSIELHKQRGFAIGHSLEGASTYATWQFNVGDGEVRDFYLGSYYDELAEAKQSYIARILGHMYGIDIRAVGRDSGVPLIGHREEDTLSDKANGEAKRVSVMEQIRESRSASKLAAQSTQHTQHTKPKQTTHSEQKSSDQPVQVPTDKNKKRGGPEL